MHSSSSSLSGTPRRRRSRSSSISSSQGSIKQDTRVHVFVRARPFDETTSTATIPLDYPSEKEIRLIEQKQETTYKFDHVFSPSATNQEVCNVICSPLIDTVLDGYNGSFLVYGQSGTGKSFTVQSEDGLIPTTINELFDRIEKDKSHSYKVYMSYLQIYHERIYDLLDPNKEADMHLREHPTEGIIIEGLTEFAISSTREAEQLIGLGRKQLIVAETKMVRMSSRSHSICLLRVEKKMVPKEFTLLDETDLTQLHSEFIKPEDACWKGKLYLCDLAGSERLKKSGITGDRLKEARYINSSLLELGNVIHALSASKYQHIPFRNSTLTRLLKESLGGNSRASLMICISSSPHHISETKCSLNFGQRALRVTKSSSPNVEHIAQPYTVIKPRTSSMQLPKIDYKALSEYLSKKLKELETAYNAEKQSYIKMQEEMTASKKGVSRIPVPLSRTQSNWKDERSRKFQEGRELKREELAEITEEQVKLHVEDPALFMEESDVHIDVDGTRLSPFQQKTQSTWTDATDSSSSGPKTVVDKETIMDEPFFQLNKQLTVGGTQQKDFVTMASQTDENANLIFSSKVEEKGTDIPDLKQSTPCLFGKSESLRNSMVNDPAYLLHGTEQPVRSSECLTASSQTEDKGFMQFNSQYKKDIAVASVGTEDQLPLHDYISDSLPKQEPVSEMEPVFSDFKATNTDEKTKSNGTPAVAPGCESTSTDSAAAGYSNSFTSTENTKESLARSKEDNEQRHDLDPGEGAKMLTDEVKTLGLKYKKVCKVGDLLPFHKLTETNQKQQTALPDQEHLQDDSTCDLKLSESKGRLPVVEAISRAQVIEEQLCYSSEQHDEYHRKPLPDTEDAKYEAGESIKQIQLPLEEGKVVDSQSSEGPHHPLHEKLELTSCENIATEADSDARVNVERTFNEEFKTKETMEVEKQLISNDLTTKLLIDENCNVENVIRIQREKEQQTKDRPYTTIEHKTQGGAEEQNARQTEPDFKANEISHNGKGFKPIDSSNIPFNIEDNIMKVCVAESKETSDKEREEVQVVNICETGLKEVSNFPELKCHSSYTEHKDDNEIYPVKALSAVNDETEDGILDTEYQRETENIMTEEDESQNESTLVGQDESTLVANDQATLVNTTNQNFDSNSETIQSTKDKMSVAYNAHEDRMTSITADKITSLPSDCESLTSRQKDKAIGDNPVSQSKMMHNATEERAAIVVDKTFAIVDSNDFFVKKEDTCFDLDKSSVTKDGILAASEDTILKAHFNRPIDVQSEGIESAQDEKLIPLDTTQSKSNQTELITPTSQAISVKEDNVSMKGNISVSPSLDKNDIEDSSVAYVSKEKETGHFSAPSNLLKPNKTSSSTLKSEGEKQEVVEGTTSKQEELTTKGNVMEANKDDNEEPKKYFDDSGFMSFEPVEEKRQDTLTQGLPMNTIFSPTETSDVKATADHNKASMLDEDPARIGSDFGIDTGEGFQVAWSNLSSSQDNQSEEKAPIKSNIIAFQGETIVRQQTDSFIKETLELPNKNLEVKELDAVDFGKTGPLEKSSSKRNLKTAQTSSTAEPASVFKDDKSLVIQNPNSLAIYDAKSFAAPEVGKLVSVEESAPCRDERSDAALKLPKSQNFLESEDRTLATDRVKAIEDVEGTSNDNIKGLPVVQESVLGSNLKLKEIGQAEPKAENVGQLQKDSHRQERSVEKRNVGDSLFGLNSHFLGMEKGSLLESDVKSKQVVDDTITPQISHSDYSSFMQDSLLDMEIKTFIDSHLEKPASAPELKEGSEKFVTDSIDKTHETTIVTDKTLQEPLVQILDQENLQRQRQSRDETKSSFTRDVGLSDKLNILPKGRINSSTKNENSQRSKDNSANGPEGHEKNLYFRDADLVGFQDSCNSHNGQRNIELTSGGKAQDEFPIIQGIVTDDQHSLIKKAAIVDNSEVERRRFRPVSIGEARKIASPTDDEGTVTPTSEISDFMAQKQVLKNLIETESVSVDASICSDLTVTDSTTPLVQISPLEESTLERFSYQKPASVSPSPSSTSTDSELNHALKEKDKLKKALTSVKSQYEGLLQEFDRIIASNSGANDENIKISKESYQMALQCKEELETELTKAKEQLAIVIAANEEQKEGLLWQTSDSEFSEDTESVIPESEDGDMTPRATSTPLPAKDIDDKLSERTVKSGGDVRDIGPCLIRIDEEVSSSADGKGKPVASVRTKTEPHRVSGANISHDLLNLAYKVSGHNEENVSAIDNPSLDQKTEQINPDLHKFSSSELQRLPATLPRRRGSSRRPKTMVLEEGIPSDFKWINKRGATSEEQARKNQKLTLQAIENAELKKELLLTKLEKIRLEAMLSCVMMRLSPNEVDSSFRKISVNSITSSSSTLRSTASLTNIPQTDPTSPFQPMSPIKRSNPRVGSPLSGRTSSPLHPRVRFGEPYKAPSSTMSPRSSSVFGHLSQLTQSSLSPSSLDFDISSCTSSEFRDSPVPLERFSPYGQDDDSLNSPYTKGKGKPDGQPGDEELAVAYKGKNKMLLTACLPFLRKKKGGRRHSKTDDKSRKDSHGTAC